MGARRFRVLGGPPLSCPPPRAFASQDRKDTVAAPTAPTRWITIGVDTHKGRHVAAAVDQSGRVLASTQAPRRSTGASNCWPGPRRTVGSTGSGSRAPAPTVLAWPASCAPPGSRSLRSIGQTGRLDAARATPTPSTPKRPRVLPGRRRVRRPQGARWCRGGHPGAAGRQTLRAQGPHAGRQPARARWSSAPRNRCAVSCARWLPPPGSGRVAALRCGQAPTDAVAATKLAMGELARR
jgi:hypothetical protein